MDIYLIGIEVCGVFVRYWWNTGTMISHVTHHHPSVPPVSDEDSEMESKAHNSFYAVEIK